MRIHYNRNVIAWIFFDNKFITFGLLCFFYFFHIVGLFSSTHKHRHTHTHTHARTHTHTHIYIYIHSFNLEPILNYSVFSIFFHIVGFFSYTHTHAHIYIYIYIYSFRVLHICVSWWFIRGVWVKVSLLKSPGLFSVFWPLTIMLSFGWSPLVCQLPNPPSPFNNP